MERAGFLESGDSSDMKDTVFVRLFFIGVVAPLIAMLPFCFEVTDDPSEDVIVTSLFFGMVTASVPFFFESPLWNEFAKVRRIHALKIKFS